MTKSYKCSICGRQNVKLWRPFGHYEPLICAKCAEGRQTQRTYYKMIWDKKPGLYMVRRQIGVNILAPKWEVEDKGCVPSWPSNDYKEAPMMNDMLIVNLKDVSSVFQCGRTSMVPAVWNNDGEYYKYFFCPKEEYKKWQGLPTH